MTSALRGKRGQKFLADLVVALDALPEKALILNELETTEGVCALGAVGKLRGIPLGDVDTYDWDELGDKFDIAHQLAREVMYVNDESGGSPEERWTTVRGWAAQHLKSEVKL